MSSFPNDHSSNIILWVGNPVFLPYVCAHIFSYKGTVQILLLGIGIPFLGSLWYNTSFDWKSVFVFVGILAASIIFNFILQIVRYRNIKYWITKDAIYVQTGLIKLTVNAIKKDKIIFIDIEKSKVDIKHKTGTILINNGETEKGDFRKFKVYKRLISVRNPEDALRFL